MESVRSPISFVVAEVNACITFFGLTPIIAVEFSSTSSGNSVAGLFGLTATLFSVSCIVLPIGPLLDLQYVICAGETNAGVGVDVKDRGNS